MKHQETIYSSYFIVCNKSQGDLSLKQDVLWRTYLKSTPKMKRKKHTSRHTVRPKTAGIQKKMREIEDKAANSEWSELKNYENTWKLSNTEDRPWSEGQKAHWLLGMYFYCLFVCLEASTQKMADYLWKIIEAGIWLHCTTQRQGQVVIHYRRNKMQYNQMHFSGKSDRC